MYCSKCGAPVTENYCTVCGKRTRSEIELFRIEERRKRNGFIRSRKDRPYSTHIAEMCWYAVAGKTRLEDCVDWMHDRVFPDARQCLTRVEELANRLYAKMEAELESGDYE